MRHENWVRLRKRRSDIELVTAEDSSQYELISFEAGISEKFDEDLRMASPYHAITKGLDNNGENSHLHYRPHYRTIHHKPKIIQLPLLSRFQKRLQNGSFRRRAASFTLSVSGRNSFVVRLSVTRTMLTPWWQLQQSKRERERWPLIGDRRNHLQSTQPCDIHTD